MLPSDIRNQIRRIGNHYNASKIVLFGSRARGNERERSDIDIAVFGLSEDKQALFLSAVEDIGTLLDFDVVFVGKATAQSLMSNIEKDGIVIMGKSFEKCLSFEDALKRLDESIEDYNKYSLDSIRDGAIQRFEFCTELAWKTVREYLIDQGYTSINSPKSVMKTAYADGLIDEEIIWIDILNSRNITSHIYDEGTSKTVYEHVEDIYRPAFYKLLEKLKSRIQV